MKNGAENTLTQTFGKSCNTNERLGMIAGLVALYFYFVYCSFAVNKGSWTLEGFALIFGPLLLVPVYSSQELWICKPGELIIETSSLVSRHSLHIRPEDVADIAVFANISEDAESYEVRVTLTPGTYSITHYKKAAADAMCLSVRNSLSL
jgi:hypothetical protein